MNPSLTVLIVDDQPTNLRVLRAQLEAEGVQFRADGRIDLERYLWLPTR